MNKVYIILAHKNEQQVKRLIDSLNDGCSTFYLHIDYNINIAGFKKIFHHDHRVHFVRRVKTNWGTFGLVKATLNAMRSIKKKESFDKVILLSGQDYPIKSNEEIDSFFKDSPYKIFMDHFPLPNYIKWGADGGMYRVEKYFFGLSPIQKLLAKILNFLGLYFPAIKRKIVNNMQPFSGSQWWAMDMPALNYILDYIHHHPEYTRFHKNTFAPDELFFQMILLNCNDEEIKKSIINNNLRYMKWGSGAIAHPEVLKITDLEQLSNSSALFARKFDSRIDEQVINVIDEKFLNGFISAV